MLQSIRSASLVGLLFASVLLLVPEDAIAQRWMQTARVVTPVEQEGLRAFLDTVVAEMEERDARIHRTPSQSDTTTVSALRDQLIEEDGLSLSSANHAFIDYRFTIDSGRGFEQEITSIRFVYRPGTAENDISILYVDTREGWVDQLLHNKGTSLATNEAALIPFHRHLGFTRIARQEESQIVEIGGETIREGFHDKKEALLQKVQRLTYETYV
jgi:hypothetical protein